MASFRSSFPGSISATVISLLAVLSGYFILHHTYHFLSFLHYHFLHRSTLQRYRSVSNAETNKTEDDASFALVTGATDGIGCAFVSALLSSGFNIVLHGRNPSKLSRVQSELQVRHPSRTIITWQCDASEGSTWSNAFTSLHSTIESHHAVLRVLVNNVGGTAHALPTMSALATREAESLNQIIDVNASFPAATTHNLLPVLIKNGPSLVLNIGSMAGLHPLPYLSVYSASKAFNRGLSLALSIEMEAETHDVEVIHVLVARTISAGGKKHGWKRSLFTPEAEELAQATLAKVGCGRREIVAWWPHELQAWFMGMMPEWMRKKALTFAAKEETEAERKGA